MYGGLDVRSPTGEVDVPLIVRLHCPDTIIRPGASSRYSRRCVCMCVCLCGSVFVARSGWGNGEVNGDAVREGRLGWNDVIGNREEGS